jgi:AraC-like DNA-binding protein
MAQIVSLETHDPEVSGRSRAPGWEKRIWKLRPGPFLNRWRRVHLAPGLIAERITMSGRVRVSGALQKGHLHIGFYVAPAARLMGTPIDRAEMAVMAVTPGGAYWESSSLQEITGWNLQVGPEFSESLLIASGAQPFLEDRCNTSLGRAAIWISEKGVGASLLERLKSVTSLPETAPELDDPALAQGLLSDAQRALRDIQSVLARQTPTANTRRFEIAQYVENALWNATPEMARVNSSEARAHLCQQLGVSVRTLQLAINEQFGVGFHQLVHAIRLHLARRRLFQASGRTSVTEVALAHGFTHLGRFSFYYRSMFGDLPSDAQRGRAS